MDQEDFAELSINELWDRLNSTMTMEKLDVAMTLSRRLLDQQSFAESVAVSEQVVQLGEQLNDPRVQGEGWFRVGICSFALERWDESADAYLKSVPFFLGESDEGTAANAIRHAVDGLIQLDQHEEIVRICKDGAQYAEMANNDHLLGDLLHLHASALIQLNREAEAVAILESARIVWRRHEQVSRVIDTDARMAECLEALGEHDKSYALLKSAYELALSTDNKKMIAHQGLRMGRAHTIHDDFAAAETVLLRSIDLAARHDDWRIAAQGKAWLATSYRQSGRTSEAFEMATAAIRLFDAINLSDLYECVFAAGEVQLTAPRDEAAWLIRSSDILIQTFIEDGRPQEHSLEIALAQVTKWECQIQLGEFQEIPTDACQLVTPQCAEDDPEFLSWQSRVTMVQLEALALADKWEELRDRAKLLAVTGVIERYTTRDARLYYLLAKAQKHLGEPSATSLAMASAIYDAVGEQELSVQLREEAVHSGLRERIPQFI